MPPKKSLEELNVARSEAASARRVVTEQVKSGEKPFSWLLAAAYRDERVARLRLKKAIQSVPGWGPARAQNVCERAGINQERTIAWAFEHSSAQLRDLMRWVEADEDTAPWFPELHEGWPYTPPSTQLQGSV